jgi:hypothetical protein
VEALFSSTFQHWSITLPAASVEQRRSGHILQAGWTIWYLFGADERGEYLDYYAAHRMTNDRHVRLYADGGQQRLPAALDFRLISDDPEEDARLEAKYVAHNRIVTRLLASKGFVWPPSGERLSSDGP